MPEGHDPTQFVAEQLGFPVASPGESVEDRATDAVTVTSGDSASEYYDDERMYIR